MSNQDASTNENGRPPALAGDAGYLTEFELSVLMDTTHGSLSIADGGRLFRWTSDRRKEVLEAIYARMNDRQLSIR